MVIKGFEKAFIYRSTVNTVNGDKVQFRSVILVRPGDDVNSFIAEWNRISNVYTLEKEITIKEALEFPAMHDRMSLKGRMELVGDRVKYLTHEIGMVYL